VGCALEVGYVSDGTVNGPLGTRGGLAGGRARQFRRTRNGDLVELPACAQVRVEPGEMIVAYSCGGGGYGAPTARDPELVRRDVAEGWVSRARAESVYGVTLTAGGAIDRAGTAERRRTAPG